MHSYERFLTFIFVYLSCCCFLAMRSRVLVGEPQSRGFRGARYSEIWKQGVPGFIF